MLFRSLDAEETLAVPGPTDVHFFWDASSSAYHDEVGNFFVDGPDGRITQRAGGGPEGDGVDSAEAWVGIGRGYYHLGGVEDQRHEGQKMYLLSGGSDQIPLNDASCKFFTEGSRGKNIVLIQQKGYGCQPGTSVVTG